MRPSAEIEQIPKRQVNKEGSTGMSWRRRLTGAHSEVALQFEGFCFMHRLRQNQAASLKAASEGVRNNKSAMIGVSYEMRPHGISQSGASATNAITQKGN